MSSSLESLPTTEPANPTQSARVILILGGSGTGKGTQCKKLVRDLDLVYICIGDLLRDNNRSHDRITIENHMRNGTLCDTGLIVDLLKMEIRKHLEIGKTKMLVDGPRNPEQIMAFEEIFETIAAVRFNAPRDVMLARVLQRAQISGRVDDNVDAFNKRYENEQENIGSLEDYLSGLLVEYNSEGDLDESYATVKRMVDIEFRLDTARNDHTRVPVQRQDVFTGRIVTVAARLES